MTAALPEDIIIEIYKRLVDLSAVSPRSAGGLSGILSPLLHLRRASHVCRLWRTSIVNFRDLWAGSIFLHDLILSSSEWRNLVMERTRNAPLTIKGDLVLKTLPSIDRALALRDLLQENRERIRIFDVTLSGQHQTKDGKRVSEDYWDFLFIGMPLVEEFSFFVKKPNLYTEIHPTRARFFSNHAPVMKKFAAQNPDVCFGAHKLSYLPQLTEFSFCPYGSQTRVTDKLKMVGLMPNLQILVLWDSNPVSPRYWTEEPTQTVSLPSLRQLIIKDDFVSTTWLLKSIKIPSDCGLHLSCQWFDQSVRSWLIDGPQGIFFTLIKQLSMEYFSLRPPNTIQMTVCRTTVILADKVLDSNVLEDTHMPWIGSDNVPYFFIKVHLPPDYYERHSHPPIPCASLINSFFHTEGSESSASSTLTPISNPFANVTLLNFGLWTAGEGPHDNWKIVHLHIVQTIKECMTGILTLSTRAEYLSALKDSIELEDRDGLATFPSLRTLILQDEEDVDSGLQTDFLDFLAKFRS